MGMVYFLRAEDKDLFKVGITVNDLGQRIASIQTGCPYHLRVYGQINTPFYRNLEREIHQEWSDKRRRGEWFAVTAAEVDALLSRHGVTHNPPFVQLDNGKAQYLYDPESSRLYMRMKDIKRKVSDLYMATLLAATSHIIGVDGDSWIDFDVIIQDLDGDREMVEWKGALIQEAKGFMSDRRETRPLRKVQL